MTSVLSQLEVMKTFLSDLDRISTLASDVVHSGFYIITHTVLLYVFSISQCTKNVVFLKACTLRQNDFIALDCSIFTFTVYAISITVNVL